MSLRSWSRSLRAARNDTAPSATGETGMRQLTTLQVSDVASAPVRKRPAARPSPCTTRGWLYSQTAADHHGSRIDSSHDRNQPFSFILGAGQVIRGLGSGRCRHEGRRTAYADHSAELGYGSTGAGSIPPNATLVFDVELLGVQVATRGLPPSLDALAHLDRRAPAPEFPADLDRAALSRSPAR